MGSSSGLKIDGGIATKLARVVEAANALDQDGYDGGWTAEASHHPFLRRCYWPPSTPFGSS
jgi:hypothetical protein